MAIRTIKTRSAENRPRGHPPPPPHTHTLSTCTLYARKLIHQNGQCPFSFNRHLIVDKRALLAHEDIVREVTDEKMALCEKRRTSTDERPLDKRSFFFFFLLLAVFHVPLSLLITGELFLYSRCALYFPPFFQPHTPCSPRCAKCDLYILHQAYIDTEGCDIYFRGLRICIYSNSISCNQICRCDQGSPPSSYT